MQVKCWILKSPYYHSSTVSTAGSCLFFWIVNTCVPEASRFSPRHSFRVSTSDGSGTQSSHSVAGKELWTSFEYCLVTWRSTRQSSFLHMNETAGHDWMEQSQQTASTLLKLMEQQHAEAHQRLSMLSRSSFLTKGGKDKDRFLICKLHWKPTTGIHCMKVMASRQKLRENICTLDRSRTCAYAHWKASSKGLLFCNIPSRLARAGLRIFSCLEFKPCANKFPKLYTSSQT
jgi:hypothetical protein